MRDSLVDVTEVYERFDTAPIVYVPLHRYEIPTIAPYATGSAPHVRISERLDATHQVERAAAWHRTALAAGIVGAIAIGVSVGIAVSTGGSELEAAPAVVVAHAPMSRPIVTPIEDSAPAAKPMALVDVRVESNPAGAEEGRPRHAVHRTARDGRAR